MGGVVPVTQVVIIFGVNRLSRRVQIYRGVEGMNMIEKQDHPTNH
jgi:hypothetical protein